MKIKILLFTFISLFIFNIHSAAQSRIAIGTQITMGDDTRKSIDKVEVGDIILSYNSTSKVYEKKKVTDIDKLMYSRMVRLVLENKLQILTTSNYPFWSEKGWVSTDIEQTIENTRYENVKKMNIGNYLYYYDILSTSSERVAFVEGVMEPMMAYAIQIEGGGAIIANGFVVGTN